jgi:hypothetical protein
VPGRLGRVLVQFAALDQHREALVDGNGDRPAGEFEARQQEIAAIGEEIAAFDATSLVDVRVIAYSDTDYTTVRDVASEVQKAPS